MRGPSSEFSQQLHETKYRDPGETFAEFEVRLSESMSDDQAHAIKLLDIFGSQRFLPGGRVQAAMGSKRRITAYNCYVSGTIEDSLVEGKNSIMATATEAAATMRMGGGIGYDFSTIRPTGEMIKKLGSKASGPVSFMGIFNAVCDTIASAGHRRGAQMGVLRIDHPDIFTFIRSKQNGKALNGFNISVGVTDQFMECLDKGEPFPLAWGGKIYTSVDPSQLWEEIMQSTWDWAEPGILFIDRINQYNNLYYCEQIAATNPCGEQPLPPYGACLLGSFNLVKYLRVGKGGGYEFDFVQFTADIPHVVRGMDNVIDRTVYPLYEQEKEAKSKRRMGLGVTGEANAIEALGHSYGSEGYLKIKEEILCTLMESTYTASAILAKEKGAFPLYDASKYLYGKFFRSLSQETKALVKEHGIRNSHLTSIAPTGTISLCADNISSGIEPVFAYSVQRKIQTPNGSKYVFLEDYGKSVLGVEGKLCSEVDVEAHLRVLAVTQKYCDSAVSKTCNVGPEVTFEEFKEIYHRAWELGCKGCTTFRLNGKRAGILEDVESLHSSGTCSFTPDGQKICE